MNQLNQSSDTVKVFYRARAMYSMIDPEKTYNDELICLNQGILYRQQKPKQILSTFQLFPNPATESISLRYEIAEEQKAHLLIRNSIGQTVYFTNVSPKERELEINIHDLVNGIYTVQLYSVDDMVLHQEKLVIIK